MMRCKKHIQMGSLINITDSSCQAIRDPISITPHLKGLYKRIPFTNLTILKKDD